MHALTRMSIAGLVTACSLALTACGPADQAVESPEQAKPEPQASVSQPEPAPADDTPRLPAFELVNASGETVTRESLSGRVAVMYFWGTWCINCREVSPRLSAWASDLEDERVRVLAPAVAERGDPEAAFAYADSKGYVYEVLISPEDARVDDRGRPADPGLDLAQAVGASHQPGIVAAGFEGEIISVQRGIDDDGAPRSADEMMTALIADIERYLTLNG